MENTSHDVIREAISTSAKLFYVLVSICIIYVSAALSKIDHNTAISNLQALDILYALSTLSEDITDGARELRALNIPKFYHRAAAEAYTEDDYDVQNIIAKGFPDEPVPGGSLKNVVMRLSPGARCDVVLVSGSPGATFNFATIQVIARTYLVDSEDVFLVSLGHCRRNYMEFNAILFRTDDGEAVIALPKSFETAFPGLRPPAPFLSFVFNEIEEFRRTLPPLVGRYAGLDGPFVMLHVEALRHYILSYAAYRHGRYYRAEDLETATSALYQEVERRTGFVGIETTVTQIVRLGPLVFLLVTWELWRRVRLIPPSVKHESTWFPFDVQSPLALVIATLFALVPIVIGLLVCYFFIVSQGLGLVLFGRELTLHGLLALDFPAAPPIGRRGGMDYWAAALAVPFAALISLSALVSIRLLAMIRANARSGR